jgi:hypothetical protein
VTTTSAERYGIVDKNVFVNGVIERTCSETRTRNERTYDYTYIPTLTSTECDKYSGERILKSGAESCVYSVPLFSRVRYETTFSSTT